MNRIAWISRINKGWLLVALLLLVVCPLLMIRGPGHIIVKELSPDIVSRPHWIPLFTNLVMKEAFFKISVYVLLALTLCSKLLSRETRLRPLPVGSALLLFVVAATESILANLSHVLPDHYESWTLLVLGVLLIYILNDRNWKREEVLRLSGWLVLTGVVVALMATSQHLQFYWWGLLPQADDRNRMAATIGHNNGVACFIMLCSAALLYLRKNGHYTQRWFKPATGLLLVWFGFILLATLSRGVWLGVLAGALLLFYRSVVQTGWKNFIRKFRWQIIAGALIFMVGFGILSFKNPLNPLGVSITQRLHDTLLQKKTYFRDDRIRMWAGSWTLFKDNPITGCGLGSFKYWIPLAQGEYFDQYPNTQLEPTAKLTNHSHNEYLEVLAEMGLIGFAAMGWLLFVFIRRAWKSSLITDSVLGDRSAILAGVLGVLIQSLVDFPFHVAPLAATWIFFAVWVIWEPSNQSPTTVEQNSLTLKEKATLILTGICVLLLTWPILVTLKADYAKNRLEYYLQVAEDLRMADSQEGVTAALNLAAKYGNQAVRLDPRNGRAHYQLGLAYVRLGDVLGAVHQYQLALRDMQYSDLHYDFAEASEWLRRNALEMNDQQSARAFTELAITHYRMAGFIYPPVKSLALEYHGNGKVYKPSESLFRAGLLLWESGKQTEAVKLWKKADRNDPYFMEARFLFPTVKLIDIGDKKHAEELLWQALAIDPYQREAVFRLFNLLGNPPDRIDETLPLLKRLLEKDPRDLDAMLGIGLYWQIKGDKMQAHQWADKIRAINPYFPNLYLIKP